MKEKHAVGLISAALVVGGLVGGFSFGYVVAERVCPVIDYSNWTVIAPSLLDFCGPIVTILIGGPFFFGIYLAVIWLSERNKEAA